MMCTVHDLYSLGEEFVAGCGEYAVKYMTLTSIGKGAFGFVKLAARKSDSLEVSSCIQI